MSKSWWICSRSQGTGRRSCGPTPTGTSLASSVSWRLSSTAGRCSRSFSPALPLTSPTRSTSSASEPNSTIHLDAVFSPTPGMLGRLSLGSPRTRGEVGVLGRGQAVLLLQLPGREPGHVGDPARGLQHRHPVADELERVPVPGDDHHVHVLGGGLGGQRGDEVVGLVPGQRQPGDAQRVQHLEDQAELAAEVGRGLPPVGLVLDVLLMPEGGLAAVEGRPRCGSAFPSAAP